MKFHKIGYKKHLIPTYISILNNVERIKLNLWLFPMLKNEANYIIEKKVYSSISLVKKTLQFFFLVSSLENRYRWCKCNEKFFHICNLHRVHYRHSK